MEQTTKAPTTSPMWRGAKQATEKAGEGTAYEVRPSNFIVVTPQLASLWLSQCNSNGSNEGEDSNDGDKIKNRPPSKMSVSKYVRIMQRGEWRPNPSQPISFTKDGKLVNGQHRLEAVRQAGVPIKMAVVWDAEEGDFDVIDTGKKRTLADIFCSANIKNYTAIASMVTRCVLLDKGHTLALTATGSGGAQYRELDLAKDYLKEYYLTPQTYQRVCNFMREIYKQCPKMLNLSEMGGIAMFLITKKGHDEGEVLSFFDALYYGGREYQYLKDLGAILINDIKSDKPMRGSRKQSLIAKAWNMFLSDSHAKKVKVRMGEIVDFN